MCECGTVARLKDEIAGKDRTLRRMAAQVRHLQSRLTKAGLDARLPHVKVVRKCVDGPRR